MSPMKNPKFSVAASTTKNPKTTFSRFTPSSWPLAAPSTDLDGRDVGWHLESPARPPGSPRLVGPDPAQRLRPGGLTQRRQAVHVLDRAQQAVVVDPLVALARSHHRTHQEGRDVVGGGPVVLVERDHQQAVVLLRPAHVAGQLGGGPAVPGGHPAVVHVVAQ